MRFEPINPAPPVITIIKNLKLKLLKLKNLLNSNQNKSRYIYQTNFFPIIITFFRLIKPIYPYKK